MTERTLAPEELESIRKRATDTLQGLKVETAVAAQNSDASVTSWLAKEPLDPQSTSEQCRFFHQYGFLVVENFVGKCVECLLLLYVCCARRRRHAHVIIIFSLFHRQFIQIHRF